jgi:hypothetical protein
MAEAVRRPGATRARFGVKEGEKLPMGEVRAEIARLKAKSKSAGGKGLTIADRRKLKQDVLAGTYRKYSR